MRTVPGRTEHVVVVGAGLSGLSAALQLAGRGRSVTVVERHQFPGGRVGQADIRGYRIDTGATVLTMPDIIEEAFHCVGASMSDHLELMSLDPAYRASFADGSVLDVHTDADAMTSAIAAFAGPDQAAGYQRLRQWLTQLYHLEIDGFIGSNFSSPLSLLTPQLARLAAIGGFRGWEKMVSRFITDERVQRIFTFQALYAGVPPQQALAAYAVIAYMDTVAGCTSPRGGMRLFPKRWPPPERRQACGSATAPPLLPWSGPVRGSPASSLTPAIGSLVTHRSHYRTAADLPASRPDTPPTRPVAAGALGIGHARRSAPCRIRIGQTGAGAPQHQLRREMVADLRRDHPSRGTHERPVAADHPAHRK